MVILTMQQPCHPFSDLQRFPEPKTLQEANQLFASRARQMLLYGYAWMEVIEEHNFGYTSPFVQGGTVFIGVISKNPNRHSLELSNYVNQSDSPYFLHLNLHRRHDFVCYTDSKFQPLRYWGENESCYKTIEQYYGNQRAKRSGVLKMNHIDEGLVIIERAADLINQYSDVDVQNTMKAFCLHPMLQSDEALVEVMSDIPDIGLMPHKALIYAMEYRSIANDYLSPKHINNIGDIKLSVLPEVNLMLIADKVQNYKDFIMYHKGYHPRSDELNEYFTNWLCKLDVHHGLYHKLIKHIPST